MYSYISGELVEVNEDSIVVDNQGIGYRFYVPKTMQYQMHHIGEMIKVYTYLHVREDAMQIFGFSTKEELELFKLLIGVNGIGAKNGLAILGTLSVSDLRFAILAEDAKAIASAPGIGSKTAQRVIIDLKDKIDQVPVSGTNHMTSISADDAVKTDVMEAMKALGYSASEALRAMDGMEIGENDSVESILKEVLKRISF